MADKTESSLHVSRNEAADLLQGIARELRGEGTANITVGNKTVQLTPASMIDYEIATDERSPMLRKSEETVTIQLRWSVDDE